MTVVSIHQPIYFPWLAYFDKMKRSDVHIVLDHVVVGKGGCYNRNKIRTQLGWSWLTIPIANRGSRSTPIGEIQIAGDKWKKKNLGMIEQNYSRSPLWNRHKMFFDILYAGEYARLIEPVGIAIGYLMAEFGVKTEHVSSSRMDPQGTGSDTILDLCRKVDATKYLSGPFGRSYLDIASFHKAGIEIEYTDYKHPVYAQQYPEFVPGMSAIDAMLNGYVMP